MRPKQKSNLDDHLLEGLHTRLVEVKEQIYFHRAGLREMEAIKNEIEHWLGPSLNGSPPLAEDDEEILSIGRQAANIARQRALRSQPAPPAPKPQKKVKAARKPEPQAQNKSQPTQKPARKKNKQRYHAGDPITPNKWYTHEEMIDLIGERYRHAAIDDRNQQILKAKLEGKRFIYLGSDITDWLGKRTKEKIRVKTTTRAKRK